MASNLSGRELYKYEWRSEVFLKKYSSGDPFELVSGRKVTFIPDKTIIEEVRLRKSTANMFLLDNEGNRYKFSDLAKTKEFGGKGERSGTLKEDRELESLKSQINEAKIREASSTIKIVIRNRTYNVFDAASTPGTPKSDFHLIDIDGKEIVWISHKDGRTERDFQQWGGISQSKEPSIYNHREVQQFVSDLKKMYPDGLPKATTLYREINDNRLKMLSVYGNKYGSQLGQQNVTILLQGSIKLDKRPNGYELSAYNVHYNGDDMTGGYEPVLMAVYKGDRSDAGVKGTRIVISPIGGRKGIQFS